MSFDGGGTRKQVAVSIKSGEYLKYGLPPKDLVEDLWRQLLGEGVRALPENDELVIAAPLITSEQAKDWRELCAWARVQTDDAIEANVTKANVGNDFKRRLFASFECPDVLAVGRAPDQLHVGRVLRRLQIVEHDFRIPNSSRCVEEGIKRCGEALVDSSRTNAESLWLHLQQIAEQMRPNSGQLGYEQLLAHIRGKHRLASHPNDTADWSVLDAETDRRLRRVSDSIGGLRLEREHAVQQLRIDVESGPLVVLIAESGEGKTVCAKRLADALRSEEHRIVWLEVDQLCSPDESGRRLGLNCPLETLLRRVPESGAFLFVDQIDQFDNAGLQQLYSLLEHLSEWRMILSATPEGWRRIEQRIARAVEMRGAARLFHLPQFTRDEIDAVGGQHPHLGRILEDRRVRRIVLRPRILDLIAQESVTHAAASQWVSEADIIDWFFERVVERRAGDGRRSTLVRLAARLADEFAPSLPEDVADPADAERIAALHADRILRIQDGRIAFDHPLLADWSKRQYLIARENKIVEELKSNTRRDNPAWHRGLALFGLRLIEQRKDAQGFISLLNALEPDGGPTSCGDSLLASVVTAIDPVALLDRLWPFLNINPKLLQRVLRVNHLVGTVPHPEVQDERLRRPISWHYPLLVTWLHARQAEVIGVAPEEVAVIAETWLRTAGQRPNYAARVEAATLALALATAARADSDEHRLHVDAKPAYQALLAAVPVAPDTAIELIRRCAERVADDPSARKHEWTTRFDSVFENNPKDLPPISPDAPLRAVDHAFREIGHDWIAIEPLMAHSPRTAMEVILATLLQPVERHPYASFGFDALDGAASSEPDWSPPMWWHGPFARLLRINERVGIDLILRLVNHVTEVWQYDAERSMYRDRIPIPYMEIEVDGVIQRWPGGGAEADNVFSWHSLGHRCPRSVQCALMALEHYLYQAEPDGRDVDAAIEQVLNGSRSAAFAGLLAAFANHRPVLLQGQLQPLLTCTEAVWHDELRSKQREDKLCAGIGLPLRSRATQEQVSKWYCMKHRDSSLLSQLMILVVQEVPLPLFVGVRNRLTQRIVNGETGDETCSLPLLIAWYNPANWRVTDTPQGLYIEFVRPAHLRPSDEDTLKMQWEQDVLYLPMRARNLIDERKPPDDEAMENLWARFDEFAASVQEDQKERRCVNAVAGIAAVAIVHRPDWLKREEGRHERAVALIDNIAGSPPAPSGFDSPDQLYDYGWDAFHADVAGTLYAREPEDSASRERVLLAVTGVHYIVVGHLLRAFISARDPKKGVPLFPLLNIITEFAALREACNLDPALVKRAEEEFEEIAESFIQGSFENRVQSWISIANRWKGVLCEGLMIQVIATAPRPTVNEAFFADPTWAAVVEQGVEWLLHADSTIEAQDKDVTDNSDMEHWPERGVGYELENAIIRLAAEAAVHSPNDSWSTGVAEKCLALPGKRHGARVGFAMWFASYAMGGADDEFPAEAVRRWTSLARVVLDLEERTSTVDDLSTAALGLSLMSEYSWPDKATPAVTALAPHFERWIKSPRRKVEDAITFAYFLIRPAATPLRLSGIEWLASNANLTKPQRWHLDNRRWPLLNLLESATSSPSLGSISPSVRESIAKLLSVLAAVGDERAIDLQRSFGP